MDSSAQQDAARESPGRRRVPVRPAIVFLLLWSLLVVASFGLDVRPSSETVVTESVCRLLLRDSDEGRQALVSSIWWPPLSYLLRLPLVALGSSPEVPFSSVAISSLFGLASLVLVRRLLTEFGYGLTREVVVLAILAYPGFLHACMDGSNFTTVLALTLLTAGGVVTWIRSRSVWSLARIGFGAALLCSVSIEMWAWLGVVFALLLADLFALKRKRGQFEAVILLAVMPTLYMIGLWLLLNWLIMGDPLYCVRSIVTSFPVSESHATAMPLPVAAAAGGLPALVLLVALIRRQREGVYLAILAMAPIALMLAGSGTRLPWNSAVWLAMFYPLMVLAGAAIAAGSGRAGHVMRAGALAIVIAAAAVSLKISSLRTHAHTGQHPNASRESTDPDPLRQIRDYVLQRSRYAKVFVCGYESFHLLGADPGPVFAHSLDLNFNQVKNDYHGHQLYVLVHRPVGRGAMDSVHWLYEDIYTLGSRATLWDGDWGDWRLFEIIEAPRRKHL